MLRQQEMMDSIKLAASIGVMVAAGVGFLIFLLTIV
jgi:preprotein translocase subunit Sss1